MPWTSAAAVWGRGPGVLAGLPGIRRSLAMFLGLDPSFPGRPCTYALLDQRPHLLELGRTPEVPELVERSRPLVVAVDAPLSLPRGWGCLDWPCTCGRCTAPPTARRRAELALASVGLFWTTKRSILKPLVEWAMALRQDLESRGWTVVEVYPRAARLRLLGRPPAAKGTRLGRTWTQEGLRRLVGGLPTPGEELLGHDSLDALLAAYTAFLCWRGGVEILGDPEEGVILVPAVAEREAMC